MNILDRIIARKIQEVELQKSIVPVARLEQEPLFGRETFSLKNNLQRSRTGIIAEFKRQSPSKGTINDTASPEDVVPAYIHAGAAAVSILTDTEFFGGNNYDVLRARPLIEAPILRKEFIIDEYQVLEARAIGADAILLIAAVLSPHQIRSLAEFAKSLQLDVLMEVHDLEELQRSLNEHLDVVGVNNRNLKNFDVSLDVSKQLAAHIPDEFVKISESGISAPEHLVELREYGYQGFLIGENFMKTTDPGRSFREFVKQQGVLTDVK